MAADPCPPDSEVSPVQPPEIIINYDMVQIKEISEARLSGI
jgi:hypothetical protein